MVDYINANGNFELVLEQVFDNEFDITGLIDNCSLVQSLMQPSPNNSNMSVDRYNFLETVKSILCQTYKNWKLIIVDDCSNKETISVLKKIKKNKKIKIFWLKKNHGA